LGDEHRYREIFVPDSGTLLDIFVFDVTADHWQSVLTFLSANYELAYLEDGSVASSCPDFATIWERTTEKAITLKVLLIGFTCQHAFFRS
jgi:hypothetical protein